MSVRDHADHPIQTLGQLIERAAESDRVVHFVDRQRNVQTLSYARIAREAQQTATALAELGVRAQDRVAIFTRTCPEFYHAFFGAAMLGAVPVPMYPPAQLGALDEYQARTDEMLRVARCRVVASETALASLLAPIAARCGAALHVLGSRPDRRTEPILVGADATALVQFSSGTTGQPRGVRLTHRQILTNVRNIHQLILQAWPEGPTLRHVAGCWLPLYHDMGLIGCVFTALMHPADIVLISPEVFIADPGIWLWAISNWNVTVSPAPNFAFSYCAQRMTAAQDDGLDLSSWRVALNGAEAVTSDAMERFIERFEPRGLRAEALTPVYGLSEATLLVCASPLGARAEGTLFERARLELDGVAVLAREGSADTVTVHGVGRPVAGYSIEIRDEHEHERPAGCVGGIWIRGPSLMAGYEGNEQASFDARGWFDTGDLGFVFEGQLFIYARRKDIIVVRGRNIRPELFERAAERVSGVRKGRSAAFGVPDPSTGTEVVVLLVEASERGESRDHEALAHAVIRQVTEATGIRPRDVCVAERGALPRTSNGKIRRDACRRRYVAEHRRLA